jgi:8-oxo-dGTP pyrophosphatase MutT (NUDIX family)
METAVKEAAEEANVPEKLARSVKPAGTVSFFYQSERGLFPNTEFIFDLELPECFVPSNNDGEVSGFELVTAAELIDKITSKDYKVTSIPIALDWLVRHGHVTTETEPNLPGLVEQLHLPLHTLYQGY